MSFKLKCQGKNPIKQTDDEFRRIAEIKDTRARLNEEIPYNEKVSEKERLTSEIRDIPKQQVLGSSGSLGLIMGGGVTSLANLAKNIFKFGGKKVIAKELSNKIDK